MSKKKKVLVFGAFDGLHDGHRFFLTEARRLGSRLIVSVATDEVIERLKKHRPRQTLEERIRTLKKSGLVDKAVSGDSTLNNWSAVKLIQPDIVALGYDQTRLEEKLREYLAKENLSVELVKIQPHEPDRLHSRFLRKK